MPNTTKAQNKPSHVTKVSVFDDLGLEPAEVVQAKIKSDLWRDLMAHIETVHLTQKELAKKLGVHQPDVSNLRAGKLSKFSVDTLIRYAVKMGLGVKTKLTTPKSQKSITHTSLSSPRRTHHAKELAGAA